MGEDFPFNFLIFKSFLMRLKECGFLPSHRLALFFPDSAPCCRRLGASERCKGEAGEAGLNRVSWVESSYFRRKHGMDLLLSQRWAAAYFSVFSLDYPEFLFYSPRMSHFPKSLALFSFITSTISWLSIQSLFCQWNSSHLSVVYSQGQAAVSKDGKHL